MNEQQKWCVFCESDIAPTPVDPVEIEIVSRDEEFQAFYYAHSERLGQSGPRLVREYVATWRD